MINLLTERIIYIRGYEIMEQIKNYLVEAIMTTQDEKMLKLLYSFLKGYQLRKTNSNKTA